MSRFLSSKYILRSSILVLSLCILLSGCSQSASNPAGEMPVEPAVGKGGSADQSNLVIAKLADGILHCLATNHYEWLKHYTISDLNGPQVARVLVGDAAFDHNITGWNVSEIEIAYSADKTAAIASIPVKHIARINPKLGTQTTIFKFQFIYSAEHERWLLNIK